MCEVTCPEHPSRVQHSTARTRAWNQLGRSPIWPAGSYDRCDQHRLKRIYGFLAILVRIPWKITKPSIQCRAIIGPKSNDNPLLVVVGSYVGPLWVCVWYVPDFDQLSCRSACAPHSLISTLCLMWKKLNMLSGQIRAKTVCQYYQPQTKGQRHQSALSKHVLMLF